MAKSKTLFVYETMKQDILNGAFAPDTKLGTEKLCEKYQVSPGAIREALSRLTSDGLVVMQAQRGFRVAPISRADLIDLTRVRITFEKQCLARSIELGDVVWEAKLAASWHLLSNTPSYEDTTSEHMNPAWLTAHTAFHDCLIAGDSSDWAIKVRDLLYLQAERYRRLNLSIVRASRDVHTEHLLLYQATMDRDIDSACAKLGDHLQRTADILLKSNTIP